MCFINQSVNIASQSLSRDARVGKMDPVPCARLGKQPICHLNATESGLVTTFRNRRPSRPSAPPSSHARVGTRSPRATGRCFHPYSARQFMQSTSDDVAATTSLPPSCSSTSPAYCPTAGSCSLHLASLGTCKSPSAAIGSSGQRDPSYGQPPEQPVRVLRRRHNSRRHTESRRGNGEGPIARTRRGSCQASRDR